MSRTNRINNPVRSTARRVAASQSPRPDKFSLRTEHFASGGDNEPYRYHASDKWIEHRVSSCKQEKARANRRERHPNVAKIVNVCEPNGRIARTWFTQEPSNAIVGPCCQQSHDGRNETRHRHGMQKPLNSLPEQNSAYRHQSNRVEQVRATLQCS